MYRHCCREVQRLLLVVASALAFWTSVSQHVAHALVTPSWPIPRRSSSTTTATRRSAAFGKLHASSSSSFEYALLFDCDGVILETEELHRLAYNAAFDEFQLTLANGEPVVWSVSVYIMCV